MSAHRDLVGQKFTRLTALRRVESDSRGNARYVCKCACGEITTVRACSLKNGNSRSCGCLRSESSAGRCKARAEEKRLRYRATHALSGPYALSLEELARLEEYDDENEGC